jgi:hypothetical protein
VLAKLKAQPAGAAADKGQETLAEAETEGSA